MFFKKKRPPLIVATEHRIGAAFPDDYVHYMSQSPTLQIEYLDEEWKLHPLYDDSNKQSIKKTCYDVIRETESSKDAYGFPDNAISIAANGFGDHLIFLIEGKKMKDACYFYNHETGEVDKYATCFSKLI